MDEIISTIEKWYSEAWFLFGCLDGDLSFVI